MTPACTSRRLLGTLLLLSAACSDPTGTGPGPDPVAMADLLAASMGAGTTGSDPCPAGGQLTRTFEHEASVGDGMATFSLNGEISFQGCAHSLNGKLVTIDGESALQAVHQVRLVPGGLGELIESRSHQTGTHRWRTEGYDQTCTFDIHTRTVPAEGIREVTGVMCGRKLGQ